MRLLQSFLLVLCCVSNARAEQRLQFTLTDIAGNKVSLADGRITLLSVMNRANQHDARTVADRVPHRYYGDPRLRMIVVGNLQKKFPGFLHPLVLALFHRRLDLETKRVRPIYESRNVHRDPRQDVFLVADFDGNDTARFGIAIDEKRPHVFIIAGDGRVLSHWTKVPESEDLSDALAAVADQ